MRPRRFFILLLHVALAVAMLAEIAVADDFLNDDSYEERDAPKVADPIEPVNRAIFTFNDKVYVWVLNPVATGYSKILPADIRGCVGNFFYNLGEPVRSANCLLQGRFRDSGRALSRFALNTICGVFGLADPASNEFALPPVKATLGETFAVWGIGDGFYVVAPLLGPSTLRDLTGSVVDAFAVAAYYPWGDDDVSPAIPFGVNTVNRTSLHLGEYEDLKAVSFDPYVAFRNGYFQMRDKSRNHAQSSKNK